MELLNTLKNIAEARYLHEACQSLLDQFAIIYTPISPAKLPVDAFLSESFIRSNMNLVKKIKEICVVGIATDDTFRTISENDLSLDDVDKALKNEKYEEMAFFSIDCNSSMTRTEIAALTRAFNHRMVSRPVVLFLRNDSFLTLTTCERTNYIRTGFEGTKAGKVTMLRNIDCSKPHRGHLEILNGLDLSGCRSYDDLYAKWLENFNNDLLTKKFYAELSDWYAWAVKVAKFPNDLRTDEDDAKYNHESCIRLITRLIFVWFLKQKKLIPDEFFDEKYIRENFITDFDPHNRKTQLYNAEESKYYRLILQNLFFAMLNCPIVAEGKSTPNNRRFVRESFHGKNPDYNINNLMRYKKEFKVGGSDTFLTLANTSVPFLNGGLFDCLDDKTSKMFPDGFSEERASLEQLFLPDYLFFGDEVGRRIDLSQWYDDVKKKNVSARGLIDILKRYSFTVEENTPLDQEVSLDPELLGKVFENLLASYNPETQTSARKQTGSFYTPREIVQYMVDESLVAHLKRKCGDHNEQVYRDLVSYSTDEPNLDAEQRMSIMKALYNCRVLDPACGSGAFPMGVLQQMVHVLKRIDPTNEMWNSMMVDLAIEDARKELQKVASGNEEEKAKIEENRKARLDDIENAFNQNINDPDYARKLYLIEHCIYGVDIQPIATQISKLRFFISLVVDQRPTNNPKDNFGIRPLPNLEAKFVTANTLIPLDCNNSLAYENQDVQFWESLLHELNHKMFQAKKNQEKQILKGQMANARAHMAMALENTGFLGNDGFSQLTSWDMFNQNSAASFFDPEWMFGVKDGFDVVIGNPPYGASLSDADKKIFKEKYVTAKTIKGKQKGSLDTYTLFIEKGYNCTLKNGILTFIIPISITSSDALTGVHRLLFDNCSNIRISSYAVRPKPVFENATVNTSILSITKTLTSCKEIYSTKMYRRGGNFNLQNLIDNLQFVEVSNYLKTGRIPKIGTSIEQRILDKILAFPKISSYKDNHGSPIFYRSTGGRYFKVVTNYSTGSTKEKALIINPKYSDAIGCVLSSNLSFWFYQIYSNNLDWKGYEIESFTMPLLTDNQINEINKLYEKYCEDIERNANIRISSRESRYNVDAFKEYKIVRSKSIIDSIDDYIGPIYGLSLEEIDFVKNYELEFRMSGDE